MKGGASFKIGLVVFVAGVLLAILILVPERSPIVLTVERFVTNQYSTAFLDPVTNYVCAIVTVTNLSSRGFVCGKSTDTEHIRLGPKSSWGGGIDGLVLPAHASFSLEVLVFRNFTNEVLLSFSTTQPRFPLGYLPAFLKQRLPKTVFAPRVSGVKSAEYFVASEYR